MANNVLAVLAEKVRNIEEHLKDYVTKGEIAPMRAVYYGIVSLILVAVMGALLRLIIK